MPSIRVLARLWLVMQCGQGVLLSRAEEATPSLAHPEPHTHTLLEGGWRAAPLLPADMWLSASYLDLDGAGGSISSDYSARGNATAGESATQQRRRRATESNGRRLGRPPPKPCLYPQYKRRRQRRGLAEVADEQWWRGQNETRHDVPRRLTPTTTPCCGCRQCPGVPSPGQSMRLLGANHKTGTFLALNVNKGIKQSRVYGACLTAALTQVDVHYAGLDRNEAYLNFGKGHGYRVVALVRDPFELFVSGLLYHAAGMEPWCKMKMGDQNSKATREAQHNFGIVSLLNAAPKHPKLPTPQRTESYARYLNRVDARSAMYAEILRSGHRELPSLHTALRESIIDDNIILLCLDAFSAPKNGTFDPYRETWRTAFKHFQYPEDSMKGALDLASVHDLSNKKKHSSREATHTTSHGHKRRELFEFAKIVDREEFDGHNAKLAEEFNCPQPTALLARR